MGGALIVGQGTTRDDALAEYNQQVKKAQGLGLYPDSEPEVIVEKGQYLAVGYAHS